jgi:hydroxylysine kinase
VSNETKPPTDHAQIANEHFGIVGTAVDIPGYEDSNARIETPDGLRFVLRVSPRNPDIERIRFVDEAVNAAKSASFAVPESVKTTAGTKYASLPGNRVARLLTWVDGITADDAGRPPEAAPSLGRAAGEMVRSLEPLQTRFRRDDASWDPGRSLEVITICHEHITDARHHQRVTEILIRLRSVPIDRLPAQVIHSDLNAGNVVLTDNHVSGIIDFEDVSKTIRIGELSVACAYAMLKQDDPIAVAMDVIDGYLQITRVTDLEATHLFALTLARLAVSVAVAASLPQGNPHHHHITAITWDLVTRLLAEDTNVLAAQFKEAALS